MPPLNSAQDQDQAGTIILAGVAGALETVDRNHVDALPFRRHRVTHGGAFMQDQNAVRFELGPNLGDGGGPGGLDDLDPAVDNRLGVGAVVGRIDGRKDGQIDPERLAGHRFAALDLVAQGFRRGLRQGGENAQAAGIGHRRRQLGHADALHAALHDGVGDAEQVGDTGLERHDGIVLASDLLLVDLVI